MVVTPRPVATTYWNARRESCFPGTPVVDVLYGSNSSTGTATCFSRRWPVMCRYREDACACHIFSKRERGNETEKGEQGRSLQVRRGSGGTGRRRQTVNRYVHGSQPSCRPPSRCACRYPAEPSHRHLAKERVGICMLQSCQLWLGERAVTTRSSETRVGHISALYREVGGYSVDRQTLPRALVKALSLEHVSLNHSPTYPHSPFSLQPHLLSFPASSGAASASVGTQVRAHPSPGHRHRVGVRPAEWRRP